MGKRPKMATVLYGVESVLYMQNVQNRLIAHRGCDANLPENTLIAMQSMIDGGCQAIEIDCQSTKDGCLVVIHDHTLDRTTNGKGIVFEKSFAEIRALDAGSWKGEKFSAAKVPTLEEVLELCKKNNVYLCIDFKANDQAFIDQIDQLINKTNYEDKIAVYIYDEFALEKILQKNPRYLVFWGIETIKTPQLTQHHIKKAKNAHVGFAVEHLLLGEKIITEIQKEKIPLHVWTINNHACYDYFLRHNLEAILTDTLLSEK